MPTRHLLTAPIPGPRDADVGTRLHGSNLEEEIRQATGLRTVDVTLVGDIIQVAIAGERPANEVEELERTIKAVVREHRGMTADQVADHTKRREAGERRKALADKVAVGETLTDEEVREAVSLWLLQEAEPIRRFDHRGKP